MDLHLQSDEQSSPAALAHWRWTCIRSPPLVSLAASLPNLEQRTDYADNFVTPTVVGLFGIEFGKLFHQFTSRYIAFSIWLTKETGGFIVPHVPGCRTTPIIATVAVRIIQILNLATWWIIHLFREVLVVWHRSLFPQWPTRWWLLSSGGIRALASTRDFL